MIFLNEENTMKKILHSIRLAPTNWKDETRFNGMMKLLDKYNCGIGQVALFTSDTHPPLPVKTIKEMMPFMSRRMDEIRATGLSAGINILGTIGHHEEDLEHSLIGDYHFMTNTKGEVCRGSYCMNDQKFLDEYVRPVYTELANAKPDFIWIDDDVRYGHMPIGNGCFCDCCIEKFNRVNGTSFTREALAKELDDGNIELRKLWLKHNSDAISGLFKVIADTVYSIDENIVLGFMTGEHYMSGYEFGEWADVLSDNGKHDIMWRPGGGAYNDFTYDLIMKKGEETGRQNSLLPDCVKYSQYELENFPYQLLQKTPSSTVLETCWIMTAGCTGTAFNMVPWASGEPVETLEKHMKAINNRLPFYRLLSEKTAGRQPVGIHTGWRKNSQIAVPNGNFTGVLGIVCAQFAREMFTFGLPECYDPTNAVVTLCSKRSALAWSEDEIKAALAGGIYLDAGAVDYFNENGYGDLIGFRVNGEINVDAQETYAEHTVNKDYFGSLRNCRQAFYKGESYTFERTDDKAEVVSYLTNYHSEKIADCSLGYFENKLGGRVAVSGYYPFDRISDYAKTTQFKRMMLKLSDEKLPSYVESYHKVHNHTFIENGKCIVAICNPVNEPADGLRVAIRTKSDKATVYRYDASSCEITGAAAAYSDNYRVFEVDCLPPYEMLLIETDII